MVYQIAEDFQQRVPVDWPVYEITHRCQVLALLDGVVAACIVLGQQIQDGQHRILVLAAHLVLYVILNLEAPFQKPLTLVGLPVTQ